MVVSAGRGFQWAGALQFRGFECRGLGTGQCFNRAGSTRDTRGPEHDPLSFLLQGIVELTVHIARMLL